MGFVKVVENENNNYLEAPQIQNNNDCLSHLLVCGISILDPCTEIFIFHDLLSDILERNNDYSGTLHFRRDEWGKVGGGHIFWRSLITNPQC